MSARPPRRGSPRRRRRQASVALARFETDPLRLAVAPHVGFAPGFGDLAAPAAPRPSHVFRVLRPLDLVVLDVLGWGLELVDGDDGPELVPQGAGARLEVRLPFQHLGERAFYELQGVSIPPTTLPPPPDAGNEIPEPPPIDVLAARGSRLVYAVPAGERIGFSSAGVLAAMSRLPLLVAPLATPRPTAAPAPFRGSDDLVIVALAGGVELVRSAGNLVLRNARGRRARPAEASVGSVLAAASALRTARQLLARESAVNLSRSDIAGGLGDLLVGPADRLRPRFLRPRAPRPGETAIEAPYRLILSPSARGGFAHATTPQAAPADVERVELWHSRLGVRRVKDDEVTIDERADPQRVVRAIWARDKEGVEPAQHDTLPFRMSLDGLDRVILVRQSADPELAVPLPVEAERLYLSALGAWLDLHGVWDIEPYATAEKPSIISWDHEAPMGRDQFVRVVYPGYFFPFGHRCALVKVTERKIKETANPKAYLYQRKFLIIGEPVKTYDDRRMPFREIRIRPLVTPDIRDPLKNDTPHVVDPVKRDELFWPVVEGSAKFRFTLDSLDHDGRRVRLQAPLLFVAAHRGGTQTDKNKIRNGYTGDADRPISGNGQSVAYALSGKPGDAALETVVLRFTGTPGDAGELTSTPELDEADVVVPAMRHLAPASPTTTVRYAQPYLDFGFTGKNAEPQVFLALKTAAQISFGGGTDRSGGFIQPDLPVRGLSRALGAVGDLDDLVNKPPAERFNPTKFLAGVLPKLFGLFDLTDILAVLGLDRAPAFLTEQLDVVAGLLADLEALQAAVQRSAARLAEDAAAAATTALRDQAEAARARLEAVRGQLQTRVAALVDAVGDLLALDTPSTPADVTAAVSAVLDDLADLVNELGAVVREQPLPPPVKAELERLVNGLGPIRDAAAIAQTIETITAFVNGLDPEGLSVRARFDWRPALTNFPNVADDDALFVVREDGLLLSVEARASGSGGVGADVLAELREFSLNLFPGAPLLRLGFDRLAFRAASGRKPEVDVVFRGIEFVGVLSFIETLKELIPFDGFADPPYVDVGPEGVTAGFDIGLPNVSVGVFSLENISLGADARVPFLGEAVTVGFFFCTREKPFRLTVMMIGGGGFVGIRLSPKGLVLLEMALEAGASLSINLGVASGSVSIMVGIYLRLEVDKGSLTGYFRIRGEVDVLGLISASITLELSLTYEFDTGKMVGRASITIEVEVFFFSFEVSVSCERRLAGSNGDPTFAEILDVQPDGSAPAWDAYCAAFAAA
ncbi:MAG TPA: hypothetical protein VNJ70_00740 [Thermoanaerobaculia bacterium]|nr:hypothetical protein [Thermoanaerobaculia bacterium]